MDDYRFRSQQSPLEDAPMNTLISPPRNGTGRVPQAAPAQDSRSTLPRRFTTDSGRVPTLSSLQSRYPEPPTKYPTAAQYKAQLLERKKQEYERLREQKRLFEYEMRQLDEKQLRDEQDIAAMQEDLGRAPHTLGLTGHQSEPTTPPEYRNSNSGFPTMFSRPNRYSASNLVSPPGIYNRPGRSGSQLTSPPSGMASNHFSFEEHHLPSRSVPASRRNSDEDDKEVALRQDPTSHRSTNALNRYSMPVTRREPGYDNGEHSDPSNITGFLFDDLDGSAGLSALNTGAEEGFPQLYAQKGNPNVLSASSAAVDLASQPLSAREESSRSGWGNISHHRRQQASMNSLPLQMGTTGSLSSSHPVSPDNSGAGSRAFRHSLDLKNFQREPTAESPASNMAPAASQVPATPPKLQTSFSSNDVPTVKSASGASVSASGNANAHAQQHFHNHNASIGRFPPGAMKRHSRELSGDSQIHATQPGGYPSIQSQLHANAPSFAATQAGSQAPAATAATNALASSIASFSPYYAGNFTPQAPNANYNMNMLTMSMQNMGLAGQPMGLNAYAQPQAYNGFAPVYPQSAVVPRDSQQRVIQQRRAQDSEAMSRFNNTTLEQCQGTIYDLCKDQHGCRYLQKQLENRNPEQIHMIWAETNPHVVELMTDPFGNYLCQKLLEYCNNDERTVLIQNASRDMVRIALNQHGTRALQKMIEFVTTQEHVQIIIGALQDRVVDLIQDLNGNHVIQKCLNKLTSEDANFIFLAVGNRCIEVGTHRHGCCVLQRCIDHASGQQKMWLVQKITENAQRLVQDPFGNYVVQYIIDLNEPSFTEPLIMQFRGKLSQLSRHKFSSNVIEKCLRCAPDSAKDIMVSELLNPGEMDRLLRDSFGNYVVQTALDHSTPAAKTQLIEAIRPILPGIRSTPYGRRLQAKIQGFDNGDRRTSGQSTPNDPTQGQIPLRGSALNRGMASQPAMNSGGYSNGANGLNGMNGGRGQNAYNPATAPPQPPHLHSYQTYPGGNVHPSGEGQFF